MEKKPEVSVIIPAYNRAKYLPEAIDSVLQQTFKDFEIVVVDDGSTDNTKEVLLPYMDKIKYIYQENKGCASARNCGIRNSNGEYLVFLDSDDLLEPRKLEVQVPILENNPYVGFVYSDGFYLRENLKSELKLNSAVGKDARGIEFVKLFFLNTNIYMPATLIRRKCFEDVGLFDETLKEHEDSDLLLRVALNWDVMFSDYPSAIIRYHLSNKSSNRPEVYKDYIRSAKKILDLYPDFRKQMGAEADNKIISLRNSLAHAYLENNKFREAGKSFIYCARHFKSVNYKIFLFTLILLPSWLGIPDSVIQGLVSIFQSFLKRTKACFRYLIKQKVF